MDWFLYDRDLRHERFKGLKRRKYNKLLQIVFVLNSNNSVIPLQTYLRQERITLIVAEFLL